MPLNNKILVAVPSEGTEPDSMLADKFARAPFIIVYNSNKKNYNSISNPFSKLLGGAGIQISQLIIENNVDVLITGEIGLNSLRLLQTADIDVFRCEKKSADKIIMEYIKGELHEFKSSDIINTD